MAALTIADTIELMELAGQYGDAIDDRNWDMLDNIFTEDATFSVPAAQVEMNGLADIKSYMADNPHVHPAAHLVANIRSIELKTVLSCVSGEYCRGSTRDLKTLVSRSVTAPTTTRL